MRLSLAVLAVVVSWSVTARAAGDPARGRWSSTSARSAMPSAQTHPCGWDRL
jgi:hypothetical protein